MFRGRSAHTLDAKGRVAIPARFRDYLKGLNDQRLVVTNRDRCLVAYPYEQWRAIEEQFARLSLTKPEVLRFQRVFISGATECTCDKQGRVLLPPDLRQRAGLDQEDNGNQVVMVGMLNSFEIWSKDRWEQEDSENIDNFEALSQILADQGI